MRDSQRQKVYDAEAKFRFKAETPKVESLETAQTIINEVTNAFGLDNLTVAHNKKLHRYAGQYIGWAKLIEFSGPKPNLSTVLHEVAHHANRFRGRSSVTGIYGIRPHGGGYTEAMLETVELILGEDEKRILNEAYIDKNVLVGLDEEVNHVDKNNKKWYEARNVRDQQEGKVLVVRGPGMNGKYDYFQERDPSWGDYTTSTQYYAYGFRYRKSAEKAGRRVWGDKFEIVEVNGYYDARRKHWVPN